MANKPTQGLGFNPNVRIEDEYVENLMKQIHFMNLEIDTLYFYKKGEAKGLFQNFLDEGHVRHRISADRAFDPSQGKVQRSL